MDSIITALEDYQHVLLIAGVAWAYIKWTHIRRETKAEVEKERDDHKQLVKDVIYTTLNNGLSEKMKKLIEDHEIREKENMREIMQSHIETYHRRNRR